MKSLKNLFPYLGRYKFRLGLSIFFNILTAVFTLISIPLIIPFFQILFGADISSYAPTENFHDLEANLNYFFSRLIAISDRPTALSVVCIALLVIVLLRNIFRYLTSFFLIPVRNGLVRDLRAEIMESFSSMPISYLNKQRKGDLLSISTTDVVEVEWSVIRMMELLFKSPLVIIGSLIFMFWINMQLSIIAIALMLAIGVLMGALSKNLKKKSKRTQEMLGLLNGQLDDMLSGLKIIKAYGAKHFFQKEYKIENDRHYKLNNKVLWRRDMASPLSELLGVALVIVLVWYGAKLVLASEMMPETFFAFVFAFYNVIEPSKTLSSAYYNIQKGLASMERIANVIGDAKRFDLLSGHLSVGSGLSKIEFESVNFEHDGQEILAGIDLSISSGSSIALVGKSGAGKTTFLDLLMRFYDPDHGTVYLNGADVKSYNIDEYRKLFGLVTQDTFLFNTSVEKNIILGRRLEDEGVQKAILDANAKDFIDQKKLGMATIAGDRGLRFSAGERQRLAIARAIAEDRPILIIDEATTSLDAEAEHEVLSAIQNVMKGKTTIIVSHKFSLIKGVDQIYLMDKGKIVDRGTHEELIAKDGLYKDLLSFQEGLDSAL